MTNSEQVKEEIKALGLQPGATIIPTPVAVVETNPKLLRRANIVGQIQATNATSATIYTTPTDKDFFLTGASCSVIKDVTATSVLTRINFTLFTGEARSVLAIPGLSLTAQSECLSMDFICPIQLKRGTTITVSNSTNVGNVTSNGMIIGYTVEDNQ